MLLARLWINREFFFSFFSNIYILLKVDYIMGDTITEMIGIY